MNAQPNKVEQSGKILVEGKTVVKPRRSIPESFNKVFVASFNPVDVSINVFTGPNGWVYEHTLPFGTLVFDKFLDLVTFREVMVGPDSL